MAIGRVTGPMLFSNLDRQGVNLAIDGNLTYFDVNARQVGINTSSPSYSLDVNGTARLGYITFTGSNVSSTTGTIHLGSIANVSINGGSPDNVIYTDGNGNLAFGSLSTLAGLSGFTGNNIILGTTQYLLNGNVGTSALTSGLTVADAINLLDAVLGNITNASGNLVSTTGNVSGANFLTPGNVTIGGTNFVANAQLVVDSVDSILLPKGSTAQQPGNNNGVNTEGMLRYNTTIHSVEWFNGTSWQPGSPAFTVIGDQQFTGNNVQTAFGLSTTQTTNSCIVSINGVVQIPTLAYSVSGNVLTFTEAPKTTDVIDVRPLTTTTTVTSIASNNGYQLFTVDNANAYVKTGNVTNTNTWTFTNSGTLNVPGPVTFPSGNSVRVVNVPTHSTGAAGDLAGDVAFNGSYLYYCTASYTNGSPNIWQRIAWSGNTW